MFDLVKAWPGNGGGCGREVIMIMKVLCSISTGNFCKFRNADGLSEFKEREEYNLLDVSANFNIDISVV